MQVDVQNKSKSLLGVSDLTLVAPIKRGLIPALDSRSYESRLRLVMKTLNTLRVSSLEAEPTPLIKDAVDRIRALHSFRLAVIGQEQKQLLLSVAFDGGWEPYMRRIWRDLGPLLDVMFCNCEGYLTAYDHSFAAYTGWVRGAEVGTEFFYNASSLTVNDLHYLRDKEHQRIDQAPKPLPSGNAFEQALPALAALYRLTDMYPLQGAVADAACLLRATEHLLRDEAALLRGSDPAPAGRTPTELAALRWFSKADEKKPDQAEVHKKEPGQSVPPTWAPKVQGGIIEPYPDLAHACMLLVELKDAAAAQALLEYLAPGGANGIIDAATQRTATYTAQFVNLAFTYQGLQVAGVPSGTLEQLPFEFREGMAARASILGDLRGNHPTRWTMPERNWPAVSSNGAAADRVELSSVHAIVQYACSASPPETWKESFGNEPHPLAALVKSFDAALVDSGVRILSVQAMQRFVEQPGKQTRGHFGFIDGISQPKPEIDPASATKSSDEVKLGDLLLGHENTLNDPPLTGKLWDDSTFLVIRKLKQDVEALDKVVKKAASQLTLGENDVKAQLMGRRVGGENLIDGTIGNNFNYAGDRDGSKCPFQSHVRRANPRESRDDMVAVPRIIRRGMSYGPPFAENKAAERGLVFMAYNASIAEQFEVIQAWLSGANSSSQNTYSALRDPFLGVPQDDDPGSFVFNGNQRITLGSERPFVTLEWGVYAFVPSIRALDELHAIADEAAKIEAETPEAKNSDATYKKKKDDQRELRRAVLAQKGAVAIARLQQAEQLLGFAAAADQWKIALEDVSARMAGVSQAIWAAVRQLHGGVLRTPYGVLVCSKQLVMEVFDNRGGYYTATGYAERMRKSFGEIYLGMDDGPQSQYQREATAANAAIMSVTRQEAFDSAFEITKGTLQGFFDADKERSVDVKDIVDEVLAKFSTEWFGLPDGVAVIGGGWHWRPDLQPTCPGHFQSPSRYMFQPNPGAEATEIGERHGKALKTSVRQFIESQRGQASLREARLGRALFDAIPDDPERLTRTLIGVMMGFLPTVDGNLRGALFEWISDRSLWDHQIAYLDDKGASALAKAEAALLPPLTRTLLLRPVPELTWRMVLTWHKLGSTEINPGDKIVVSIVSATQECLINDDLDLYPIFGGNRNPLNPPQPPHPTHACPGYDMAIGVMLGVLAALVETARLRPTMSAMALRLSRRV